MPLVVTNHPSPNFWQSSEPVKAIVLHGTAGDFGSSIGWLCNPDSEASANYLIDTDGTIYCLVDPYQGKRAWANGIVNSPDLSLPWLKAALDRNLNLNLCTISIEHVASSADMKSGQGHLTPAQEAASLALCDKLLTDFKLARDGTTVIGHRQIDLLNRPYCPGVIDIAERNKKLAAMESGSLKPAGNDGGGNAHPGYLDGYFPETGKYVVNVGTLPGGVEYNVGFLDYWQNNGGLAEFGFPVSGMKIGTAEDGSTMFYQDFERARLEFHTNDLKIYRGRVGAESDAAGYPKQP